MNDATFKHGSSPAAGIRYGLSLRDHSGKPRSVPPRILWGDANDCEAAIHAVRGRNRYEAGCLCFQEPDISESTKQEIISDHITVCYPGIERFRLPLLYVEHRDKGRLEIHYWHPYLDLSTGKKTKGFVTYRGDIHFRKLWVKCVNDHYGFEDPDDPKHWRLVSRPRNFADSLETNSRYKPLAAYEHERASLLDLMERQARGNLVRCRSDIVESLQRDGWKVSKSDGRSLTVTTERLGSKSIKLEGRMFTKDWKGVITPTEIAKMSATYRAEKAVRLSASVPELIRGLEVRRVDCQRRVGDTVPIAPLVDRLNLWVREVEPEQSMVRPSPVRTERVRSERVRPTTSAFVPPPPMPSTVVAPVPRTPEESIAPAPDAPREEEDPDFDFG